MDPFSLIAITVNTDAPPPPPPPLTPSFREDRWTTSSSSLSLPLFFPNFFFSLSKAHWHRFPASVTRTKTRAAHCIRYNELRATGGRVPGRCLVKVSLSSPLQSAVRRHEARRNGVREELEVERKMKEDMTERERWAWSKTLEYRFNSRQGWSFLSSYLNILVNVLQNSLSLSPCSYFHLSLSSYCISRKCCSQQKQTGAGVIHAV